MANVAIIAQVFVLLWSIITEIRFIYWYNQKKYSQIINYNLNIQLIAFFVANIILKLVNQSDIMPILAIVYYISLGVALIIGWVSVVIIFKATKMKKVQDGLLDGNELERKKRLRRKIYLGIFIFVIVVEILYRIEKYFHLI